MTLGGKCKSERGVSRPRFRRVSQASRPSSRPIQRATIMYLALVPHGSIAPEVHKVLDKIDQQAGEHSHAGRRTRRLQGTELGCRYDLSQETDPKSPCRWGPSIRRRRVRTAGRAYPNGTTRAGWRFRADDQSGGYDGQSQRWISDAIPTQFQCNSIAIVPSGEVCYEFRLASNEHQSTPNWRK